MLEIVDLLDIMPTTIASRLSIIRCCVPYEMLYPPYSTTIRVYARPWQCNRHTLLCLFTGRRFRQSQLRPRTWQPNMWGASHHRCTWCMGREPSCACRDSLTKLSPPPANKVTSCDLLRECVCVCARVSLFEHYKLCRSCLLVLLWKGCAIAVVAMLVPALGGDSIGLPPKLCKIQITRGARLVAFRLYWVVLYQSIPADPPRLLRK